ncbi:uncharacterized protein LOC130719256 [Lotus japonicus]|uniref:uncharacterized protein LOC130719256 n=1 Tax=Lotus japonicus TaxID=34305 RepID=UPI00258FB867|nr:uncharacterized protein LOC130719256 [Lotus japonicus]
MKQFNCSARVSLSQTTKHASSDSIGDGSSSDEEDDNEGDQGEGAARMVDAAVRAERPCYPLFIDGIADSVDYFQMKDLFKQHGMLTNVFLQRKRRSGRKFRFGFVRYAKKEDAVKAMEFLDGVRLGGAYISVKPEISAGKKGKSSSRRCSVPGVSLASEMLPRIQRTFKDHTTSVFAASGYLEAREVVGDPVPALYDVGSLSCDGQGSFHPSHSCFEVGACSGSGSIPIRDNLDCLEVFSDSVWEEDVLVVDAAAYGHDPALDFSPPRPRPRGRPKKSKAAKVASPRRPRSRPRKSESVTIANVPAPRSPPSPSGPYFTRAKKAWRLAQFAGMSFPGSDEDAIQGLPKLLKKIFLL